MHLHSLRAAQGGQSPRIDVPVYSSADEVVAGLRQAAHRGLGEVAEHPAGHPQLPALLHAHEPHAVGTAGRVKVFAYGNSPEGGLEGRHYRRGLQLCSADVVAEGEIVGLRCISGEKVSGCETDSCGCQRALGQQNLQLHLHELQIPKHQLSPAQSHQAQLFPHLQRTHRLSAPNPPPLLRF